MDDTSPKLTPFRHLALFAGMGGFIAASERMGFRTLFANELDEACVKVLNCSFPTTTVSSKDVRELTAGDLVHVSENVDVLTAGFPCQSFSQAGNNLGFDDERGKLFFEITRVASLLTNPPKILLLENVPFLVRFNKGERLSVILNHLRKAGYWVSKSNCLVMNSRDAVGSPQSRERLFIIACHSKYFKKNTFGIMETEIEKKQSIWDIVNREIKADKKYYLDHESKYFRMIQKNIDETKAERLQQLRRTFVRACPEGVCPTLSANMGGGGHNVPFLRDNYGIRKLTPEECLSLQGYFGNDISFPDGMSDGSKYTMIGNSIHVSLCTLIFEKIKKQLEELQNGSRLAISA